MHVFNPSTREAKAGGSLSEIYRETLSGKTNKTGKNRGEALLLVITKQVNKDLHIHFKTSK